MLEALDDVMLRKGVPVHIRSEFGARDLRKWLADTAQKRCISSPQSLGEWLLRKL